MNPKLLRVVVIFEPGKYAKPIWFDLNGDKNTVLKECYFWLSQEGKTQISHYSLKTDKGLYKLQFNSIDQGWRLQIPQE